MRTHPLLLAPFDLERDFKKKGWCLRSLHGDCLLCLSMQFLLCRFLPLYSFSLFPYWKCTPCPEQGTRFLPGLCDTGLPRDLICERVRPPYIMIVKKHSEICRQHPVILPGTLSCMPSIGEDREWTIEGRPEWS